MFPTQTHESREDLLAPDALQSRMQSIAHRAEPYPLDHVTLYSVHQRVATTFRHGRLMLVGDAAHVNNPIGGLGMNSGVHDGYSLAQYLIKIVASEQDADVLDEWSDTRRGICLQEVQQISHQNWSNIREGEGAIREKYYRELRQLAADPTQARAVLRRTALLAG
jgi:3-(3-hydroxy-phenyl)propionate hydroxylase